MPIHAGIFCQSTAAPAGAKECAVYLANLAACDLKLKRSAEAVQHCTAALELQPNYTKALMRRAVAFEDLDDLDHALEDAKKVGLQAGCSKINRSNQQRSAPLGLLNDPKIAILHLALSNLESSHAPENSSAGLSMHVGHGPYGVCEQDGIRSKHHFCCTDMLVSQTALQYLIATSTHTIQCDSLQTCQTAAHNAWHNSQLCSCMYTCSSPPGGASCRHWRQHLHSWCIVATLHAEHAHSLHAHAGTQLSELEPSNSWAHQVVARLQPVVAERHEKLKSEMLGKLKDLGNSLLGKFGLSLDNFKTEKDPSTGSYSIKFQQ